MTDDVTIRLVLLANMLGVLQREIEGLEKIIIGRHDAAIIQAQALYRIPVVKEKEPPYLFELGDDDAPKNPTTSNACSTNTVNVPIAMH